MPAFTLGSTMAAVLQFLAIMSILSFVLNTHTTSGAGPLPINTINCATPANAYNNMCVGTHLAGVLNLTNQTYIATSGQNSLTVQMGNQVLNSSTALGGTGAVLQQLGGLAFIPAAFGLTMKTLYNIPSTIILIISSVVYYQGPYVLIPFSMLALSGCLMAYYVTEFAFKVFTPITKTEISDI